MRSSGRYEQKYPALLKALPFEPFPFDPVDFAYHYGHIRASVEKSGKSIGPLDLLIAAHARAMNATLVTHNTRDFRRVPDLHSDDWS